MRRFSQIVLIATFLAFCWLAMQVVHETGHVLAARATGGRVADVVLDPRAFSRTDLANNPHPLVVVWGGPLFGAIVPLLVFAIAAGLRDRAIYLYRFFAGFCLIANGFYIGAGWLITVGGDPHDMRKNGSPLWLLILFGVLAVPAGFYLWHRQGPHFGLGVAQGKVSRAAAITSVVMFFGLLLAEMIWSAR